MNNTLIVLPASGPSWTAIVVEPALCARSITASTFCTVKNKSETSSAFKSTNLGAGLNGATNTSF